MFVDSAVCFNTCIEVSAEKFYACPGGEIGRRTSLKRKKEKPSCEFESHPGHQSLYSLMVKRRIYIP
jgi:hypothetical protein